MPVPGPAGKTRAILVIALLQVPPVVASERVVLAPWHTVFTPVMAAGEPFTVIGFSMVQLAPKE
jgi:hypothetical protein